MSKVSVIVPVYNVENYIEEMLQSVQNQSFDDFEVVMINDGSTDKSLQIIERFCQSDERFKCFTKPNGGVASARNKGIDLATGEYVVFYDPDDYIPKDALKKMYKTASSKSAEMVIGVMEEKSLGESLIYMHSQKLAKQNRVSPLDYHFFGAWSLCHKMFSLDFIRRNNLRIERLSNAEDGVFTFCALNCTDKIYGCDTVAYNYIKRPFWLAPSATQTISSEYLEGLLSSHDRILEEASSLADKYLSEKEKEIYLSRLYVRFIEGEMINGYYRGIWRATEDLTKRLEERTSLYRQHITLEQWQELMARHQDLELEKGFMPQEELAETPLVSIMVSKGIPVERLGMVLGSIYNQQLPRFEVLVSEETARSIEEFYKDKANFRVICGEEHFLEEAKGKYVLIFDEFAMFTKNSLKLMVEKLESKKGLGFAAMLMKRFDGEKYAPIPVLSASYGYTTRGKTRFTKLTEYDGFFSNKLFRKSALEGFKFSANPSEDMMRLYRNLSFEKIRKGVMITDDSRANLLQTAKQEGLGASVRWRHAGNEAITHMLQNLKRHITREDIDRFRRKMGK